MKKTNSDVVDTTGKWLCWYYGAMFLLVFIPAFSDFALAALLLPIAALPLCVVLWLFGPLGLVVASSFIILVMVQMLFASISSLFK